MERMYDRPHAAPRIAAAFASLGVTPQLAGGAARAH